jgi:hypothetical protein
MNIERDVLLGLMFTAYEIGVGHEANNYPEYLIENSHKRLGKEPEEVIAELLAEILENRLPLSA